MDVAIQHNVHYILRVSMGVCQFKRSYLYPDSAAMQMGKHDARSNCTSCRHEKWSTRHESPGTAKSSIQSEHLWVDR